MLHQPDIGKLILRLALGVLILLHGIAKLLNGIGGIEGMLVNQGLPALFAWGVFIGEVLAPLMVIIGFHTRLGAGLIAINMVVAILLAHAGDLYRLTANGGWALELQGMFLFTAFALVFLGPGRFRVHS